MVRVQHVGLHIACPLRRMIELKRRLALHIVVSPVSKAVVCADQHLAAAAGKLHRRELCLVVLFEGWCELAVHRIVTEDVLDR